MPHSPESRILSISFKRDPREHADVMLAAGRRFTAPAGPRFTWPAIFGTVVFGATIGLVMELYRRYFLTRYYPIEDIPPLNILLVQFLPFVVLLMALIGGRIALQASRSKRMLATRFEPDVFVDTDIFETGIRSSIGHTAIEMEWPAVRAVRQSKSRIEIECDAFVFYLPARAFPTERAFKATGEEILHLWKRTAGSHIDPATASPEGASAQPNTQQP